MRKHWIKRENIYEKPFYRRKLKLTLLIVFVMAIVFFGYQLFYIKQLQMEIERKSSVPQYVSEAIVVSDKRIRGIRLKDYDSYNPIVRNVFHCLSSGRPIAIDRLNDDYCDCVEDGSDEPETNACANGVFYCSYQTRHRTGRGKDLAIHSSRVNDNICDCCDGSDEWLVRNESTNKCPNTC